VIPSKKVEQLVSDEKRHLRQDGATPRIGLPARGGDAHDDVAEQSVGGIRGRARAPRALRERQHVGGSILLSIDTVELLDLLVSREQDRQLAVSHSKGGEHRARPTDDFRRRQTAVRTSLDDQTHGHASFESLHPAPRPCK
jgi:hypothetical protein